MTNETKPTHKEKTLNKRNIAVGLIGLLAAYGAGVGTTAEFSKSSTSSSISAKAMHSEAIHIAQSEELARDVAIANASSYTNLLNSGKTIPAIPVLNGLVEVNIGTNGKFIPSVEYAIVLSTLGPTKPDKNGDFLDGGFIGVVGNNSEGGVVVTPLPYDSLVNKFVPYTTNNNDILLPDVELSATQIEGGPEFNEYAVAVYDTTTHDVYQNRDGDAIFAGMGVGGK